jgi:hypothetical protein
MSIEGPTSEEVLALVPKRRLWPFALVVVLLLGGAAAGVWLLSTKPEPLRVLVAVDIDGYWWEGSKPAATFSDQIAVRLEKLGFEPVKAGDPEVTKVLERAKSPEEAAKKLGASFIVSGHLKPEVIEHPVEGGYFEVRVAGPVQLGYRSEPAKDAGTVSSWAGAKDKERALGLLAESIADMAFDAVMPAIMQHASLLEMLEGPATEKAKLSLAKGYVELREKKLAEAQSSYDALLKKRVAEERGPLKVEYHGKLDRTASLCAAGPQGFLVKISSIRPFFAPSSNELRYVLELERVAWLGPNAPEKSVFEGYNVYGYATAGTAGKPVVLVEDLFGWAKTITVIDGAAKPSRLRVDAKHRFADPKVAPGGAAVALWDRPCQQCSARLLVLSLPEGKELFRTDEKAVSLGGFTWVGPKTLTYLERTLADDVSPMDAIKAAAEGEEPKKKQFLVELDFGASPPGRTIAYTSLEGEQLGSPAASPDGKLVALQRRSDDGLHLALFDRESKKLAAHDVTGWVENPSVSPDGKLVVFERGGDIALYSRESGKVRALTKNAFVERYPIFSADGSRVAFETRDRDPNFPSRGVSLVASVPVR